MRGRSGARRAAWAGAVRLGVALVLALAPAAPRAQTVADAGKSELTPQAQRFCEAFFAGDFAVLEPMMFGSLKQAFSADKAAELRQGLTGKYGALQRIGPAWFAESVDAQRLFRVPVVFSPEPGQRTTVDLNVTFNLQERVTAFYVVPHVPPPPADAEERAPAESDDGD